MAKQITEANLCCCFHSPFLQQKHLEDAENCHQPQGFCREICNTDARTEKSCWEKLKPLGQKQEENQAVPVSIVGSHVSSFPGTVSFLLST